MCALRRENRVGSIQSPVPQPRACISSGRAARIAWRKAPRDAGDVTCKRNGGENVRGPFYGLVGCLIYQAPNAAARVASAANSPLPNATGGQKRPRRTRGFPMWAFLSINSRAGRNSRPYPRKFSSARCKTKLTCRPWRRFIRLRRGRQ